MTQSQESGARASRWGHETARKIAEIIGAVSTSKNSNEYVFDNAHVVIKCAAPKTDSVGVTYLMLKRISGVVGAFQLNPNTFDLWLLPAGVVKDAMRPTASKGSAAGKVGIVRRDMFYQKGKYIKQIVLC